MSNLTDDITYTCNYVATWGWCKLCNTDIVTYKSENVFTNTYIETTFPVMCTTRIRTHTSMVMNSGTPHRMLQLIINGQWDKLTFNGLGQSVCFTVERCLALGSHDHWFQPTTSPLVLSSQQTVRVSSKTISHQVCFSPVHLSVSGSSDFRSMLCWFHTHWLSVRLQYSFS